LRKKLEVWKKENEKNGKIVGKIGKLNGNSVGVGLW